MTDELELTDMQKAFCEALLEGKSKTEAYREAGYAVDGKYDKQRAWELSRTDTIRAYLAERRKEIQNYANVKPAQIIKEIARVGFSDIRDYVRWDETGALFIPSDELTEDQAAAIQSIKVRKRTITRENGGATETVETELKLHPKLEGLEKLMKHYGLYQQDRINDADRETHLLATVLWKFIMSLHLARGVPIQEAQRYAQQNPEEVEAWGREQKLLEPAPESTN